MCISGGCAGVNLAAKLWPPAAIRARHTRAGDQVFTRIGCDTCHVRNIVTAPAGTVINQGAFTVPSALGGQMILTFLDSL